MLDKDKKEICKIIDINKDASNFYKAAQLEAENQTVKKIFGDYENLHNDVITELKAYVVQNGADPEADATITGMTGQVWGEIKAKMSGDVDESLITSLEEAEDRCIHSLKDAIANDDISAEARMKLKKQEETLQKSHDYMKLMKQNAKAA